MTKIINEVNLIGKYIEFWHKLKVKKFKDPGKYRVGTVKKMSDGFVYVQCPCYNYLIRVARSDVIGQITHSGLRREIVWEKA